MSAFEGAEARHFAPLSGLGPANFLTYREKLIDISQIYAMILINIAMGILGGGDPCNMTKLYGTIINETCSRNDNILSNLVNLVGSNGPLTNQNTPAKQANKIVVWVQF